MNLKELWQRAHCTASRCWAVDRAYVVNGGLVTGFISFPFASSLRAADLGQDFVIFH